MTERDGAWMARKIGIGPADLHAMIAAARLAPVEEAYLERTLRARQRAILRRYLGRVSPRADVTAGDDGVCAVDLARRAGVFERFAYRATEQGQALAVLHDDGGRVCVPLAHRGLPCDHDPQRRRGRRARDRVEIDGPADRAGQCGCALVRRCW